MSTVDTSTWSPDTDFNVSIEGVPLDADSPISQTWLSIRVLMAALKGDGDAIRAFLVPFEGASASAGGDSGLVPAPQAGDQDKVLKGDGTWGSVPAPSLGTASRAVQTDANGALAVSSVTATELGHLSGVTSAVQTQLDGKLPKSGGTMTGNIFFSGTADLNGISTTHQTAITLNSGSLNFGAYDHTHSKWIYYAAPDGTCTFNGNANTAAVLFTARSIQTDLSSSSAASFDGSANATPGVTGVLSIANGGTGSSTKNFVDLSTDQNIDGKKTFAITPRITRDNPYLCFSETDLEKGVAPSSTGYQGLLFTDKNETNCAAIFYHYSTIKSSYISLVVYKANASTDTSSSEIYFIYKADGTVHFSPSTTGSVSLGQSGNKWKEIWCSQSSINSSSDERLKQDIADIPEEVLDAWGDVRWVQFKYNDAVEEKGDHARLHSGLVAQDIDRRFREHGLSAARYGLFLHDEWAAEPEEQDEAGTVVKPASEAGDAYGLRYTEALCVEAAYLRRENARLKNRLASLEDRLATIEEKLNA